MSHSRDPCITSQERESKLPAKVERTGSVKTTNPRICEGLRGQRRLPALCPKVSGDLLLAGRIRDLLINSDAKHAGCPI